MGFFIIRKEPQKESFSNCNDKSFSDLHELREMLSKMSKTYKRAVIQWIPSHCNITGNEEADKLDKEGGRLPQTDYQISYEEAKTVTKGYYYEQSKDSIQNSTPRIDILNRLAVSR